MAYETMDQFTDDLWKEKIFNCKICNELCTSDIFLVKGKGNVCGKCFQEKCGEDMRSRAELNTALILIIAKLMLPCKFQSKGCDKRVKSKMFSKHIKRCDFKIKPCPMKKLENCDWSGSNSEQTDHLLKNHDKHVIKGDNNVFDIKTSLSESVNVKVLSFDWQNYLLRTLIVDNKFYYSVNILENNDENMEYSAVHRSISTPNHFIKTIGTLNKLNDFYNEENLNKNPNATMVDIDLLKHLINEENAIINSFNLNPKELDETMLKLLECPICLNIMRPPIYLCNHGHNICILCRQKVNKCPTCEGKWTDVRNRFMENFTSYLKYPCKFKQFGCKKIGVKDNIEQHEEVCLYLSELLECQICSKTMQPPIFDCNSGHSVCFACKESNNKCPTCENEWTNTRNDTLESLTFNIKYPCINNEIGCQEIDIESEIKNHEETCPLNVEYKCPMLCDKSGSFKFILKHLNDEHKDIKYNWEPVQGFKKEETIKWFMFNSRVFRLSYYFDKKNSENIFFYSVELVCSHESPESYTYVLRDDISNITLSRTCYKERTPPLIKIFKGLSHGFLVVVTIKKETNVTK